MSYTKRTIIEQAHAEIGLGSYAYDAQPEDLQDALLRLNALMAQWSGDSAQVGWPSVNSELVDELDSDSQLPPMLLGALSVRSRLISRQGLAKSLPAIQRSQRGKARC